jgi:hypothetical protein
MSPDAGDLVWPDRSTGRQEPARSGWWWFPARFAGRRRGDSREILADHYATEARLARQLAQHAECLRSYPDASRRLRALAARTESYREVLAYTLERMGGQVPSTIASPRDGRSHWERLLIDRDDLTAALDEYLDSAYALEREHPELTALLLAIRARRSLDRQAFLRLLGRFESLVLDRPGGCVPDSAEAEPELVADPGSVTTARTSGQAGRCSKRGADEGGRQPVGASATALATARFQSEEELV